MDQGSSSWYPGFGMVFIPI